ncbi:hypothetical protein BWQ96_06223 [Gracilariopsis chorda]|uniref:Uncharacterized protein n=1 Tax=Gracilariopsis chorda TaxID=448386 RepID=A0A2V3ISB1_9FLOR|nr:hypothetical protein BWQ96_06223 [Gracilariopsis chorda]|eukprot:PXF43990.1 hypothetical protein BWQ96_06223 [Gracilariopsis chorda]
MKACEGKNRMDWVDDCEHASAQEKKDFKDKLAAARARDGPAQSTRSQVSLGGNAASSASKSVARLRQDKAKTNMGD